MPTRVVGALLFGIKERRLSSGGVEAAAPVKAPQDIGRAGQKTIGGNQFMEKNFYITTPIYYPSQKLHIGHAYCTTIADTVARYKRLTGHEVFFLTGSDEHGQKLQRAAQAHNQSPLEYIDPIVDSFKELWRRLDISYDDFIRTSEPRHQKVVQDFFERLQKNGDIYKGTYSGLYCTPCESYWLERDLDENGCCPDCHRPVEKVSEEAYFFRMSNYADRILQYIETHPDFVVPTSRRNEMINFIKQGLEDLCVSRTTFDWGIPVPNDPKHVIYVWFDAVINYITPLIGNPERMKKFWPADIHLVGKEIVRFHSIIWPCMLMAAGLPLPKQIYGHGWLVIDNEKMSKSKGNVVDPMLLIDEFGADAIRYFLLREITLGQDGSFSRDALINRINADLANDLGNLLHRTLNMIGKFQKGIVNAPRGESPIDQSLKSDARSTVENYINLMDAMELSAAIKNVWQFVSRSNKYIDETAPWKLAKDASQAQALSNVLYNLVESLRIIAVMISPLMPSTAQKIFEQLNLEPIEQLKINSIKEFGAFPRAHAVNKPQQLFPRIVVD